MYRKTTFSKYAPNSNREMHVLLSMQHFYSLFLSPILLSINQLVKKQKRVRKKFVRKRKRVNKNIFLFVYILLKAQDNLTKVRPSKKELSFVFQIK